MTRIQKLNQLMKKDTFLVFDPTSIFYFTQYKVDPGERLLLLIIQKNKDPLILLNSLFKTIFYQDGEDPLSIVEDFLQDKAEIYVDGSLPSRFLLPLLKEERSFTNGDSLIENLRRIKDKDEIEKLSIASQHNDKIMKELMDHFKEGISEKELAKIIEEKQATSPLSGISFTPISVFSENIADPHGIPSNRTLKKGDVILIDMGGTYKHYRSDMTRAFFFGENKELEKIYDIVLEANLKAIEAIQVGVPLKTVDKAARDVITNAGYGSQFIHRTGHGIGLETHETLDVSSANDTLIEEGMCFSIEPGIYIEGLGGIRIEDLVCIVDGKAKVLNQFPKDKIIIN